MTLGRRQAYFDSDQVLAASVGLDPEALRSALPERDGLRVSEVEGVGLVAARRSGDFTHVVTGLDGTHPIDLAGWQVDDGEFEALTARPHDLAFLADTPPGVATRLLDAALSGPVVFFEPDAARRADWIAWLTYALPGGAAVTFSTAGDEGVRLRAADDPAEAIDTGEACDLTPSFYARVALVLATRGGLREAVSRLEEADGVALAVHGGATEQLAPHQLPLALQLITELATSGHVREAARAAAALPTAGASTSLVVREAILPPELVEPEPEEEIVDAEVIEPEPAADDEFVIEDDEIISVPFEPAVEEPLPDVDAWSSLLAELKTEGVTPDPDLPLLPDSEPPAERSFDLGVPLDAFAASLRGAAESGSEDEVLKEEEVGMSLAELEESLKREDEQ